MAFFIKMLNLTTRLSCKIHVVYCELIYRCERLFKTAQVVPLMSSPMCNIREVRETGQCRTQTSHYSILLIGGKCSEQPPITTSLLCCQTRRHYQCKTCTMTPGDFLQSSFYSLPECLRRYKCFCSHYRHFSVQDMETFFCFISFLIILSRCLASSEHYTRIQKLAQLVCQKCKPTVAPRSPADRRPLKTLTDRVAIRCITQ